MSWLWWCNKINSKTKIVSGFLGIVSIMWLTVTLLIVVAVAMIWTVSRMIVRSLKTIPRSKICWTLLKANIKLRARKLKSGKSCLTRSSRILAIRLHRVIQNLVWTNWLKCKMSNHYKLMINHKQLHMINCHTIHRSNCIKIVRFRT